MKRVLGVGGLSCGETRIVFLVPDQSPPVTFEAAMVIASRGNSARMRHYIWQRMQNVCSHNRALRALGDGIEEPVGSGVETLDTSFMACSF